MHVGVWCCQSCALHDMPRMGRQTKSHGVQWVQTHVSDMWPHNQISAVRSLVACALRAPPCNINRQTVICLGYLGARQMAAVLDGIAHALRSHTRWLHHSKRFYGK